MSSDDLREVMADMEQRIQGGRRQLDSDVVMVGRRTEAERRFNVCLILRYLTDGNVKLGALEHILFESEDITDEALNEVMVAVALEEAFFGAFQRSLGNQWGLKIAANGLKKLSGTELGRRAYGMARAIESLIDVTPELAEEAGA